MREYVLWHWRGEMSLGWSFWINHELLGLVAWLLFSLGAADEESSILAELAWFWLPMPFLAAMSVWQVVGTWRSARRTVRERGRWFWPRLAQSWLVVGVAGLLGAASLQTLASVQLVEALLDPGLSEFHLIANEAEGALIFHGALSDRAADRLTAAIGDGRYSVLHIDSQGGLLGPAKRIARKIRQHGTKVVVKDQCISACVYLLAASRFGTIRPDSDVVFHQLQPVVTLFASYQPRFPVVDEDFLREVGVTPATYRPLDSRAFWQPTLRQMANGRLIAFVIDPDTGRQTPAYVWCLDHAEACDAPRWAPAD